MAFRRTKHTVGHINYPECSLGDYDNKSDGFYDTGEGGSEIWLLVPWKKERNEMGIRDVCCTGFELGIVSWDCVDDALDTIYLKNASPYSDDWKERGMRHYQERYALIHGGLCIGASGQSPYSPLRGAYWQPTFDDLTEKGKQLYNLVRDLYGIEPTLHFVLDT